MNIHSIPNTHSVDWPYVFSLARDINADPDVRVRVSHQVYGLVKYLLDSSDDVMRTWNYIRSEYGEDVLKQYRAWSDYLVLQELKDRLDGVDML